MPSTYDKDLVLEILTQILEAIQKVTKRFQPIVSHENFTESDEGMEKLDSICMQLIAIGESLKNLDKITSKELLSKYPGIDWKKVIGMRDIITHHYFDLDAEVIFNVCRNHIDELKDTIEKMIRNI